MDKVLVKQCLFFGSWLVFLFMAWVLWRREFRSNTHRTLTRDLPR